MPFPNPHAKLYNGEKLSRIWFIIGIVLIVASVAQPFVSSQLRNVPIEQLLESMIGMNGGEPLPPRVMALFSGVFANIQFSLIFAAIKLALGIGFLLASRNLESQKVWPRHMIMFGSILGVTAFVGIGFFFAYSATIMASEMGMPIFMVFFMVISGFVIAALPAFWLVRNFLSVKALLTA